MWVSVLYYIIIFIIIIIIIIIITYNKINEIHNVYWPETPKLSVLTKQRTIC